MKLLVTPQHAPLDARYLRGAASPRTAPKQGLVSLALNSTHLFPYIQPTAKHAAGRARAQHIRVYCTSDDGLQECQLPGSHARGNTDSPALNSTHLFLIYSRLQKHAAGRARAQHFRVYCTSDDGLQECQLPGSHARGNTASWKARQN